MTSALTNGADEESEIPDSVETEEAVSYTHLTLPTMWYV